MSPFLCNVCNIFLDTSIEGFILHARSHFKHNSTVQCPVCCKEFNRFRKLQRHLNSSNCKRTTHILHNDQLVSVLLPKEQLDNLVLETNNENINPDPSHESDLRDEIFDIESQANEQLIDGADDTRMTLAESLIAPIQDENSILTEFISTITECSARHGFTDVGVTDIASKIVKVLYTAFTHQTLNIESIADRMLEVSKSSYIRNQLISKLKCYVKPREVTVDSSIFYIIPPSQSIKALLSNKVLLNDIKNNMIHHRKIDINQNKIYFSRQDGELFESLDKHILHITIWVDDVNASRSFTRLSKHNLFAITMCIDNMTYNTSKYSKQLDLVMIGMRDEINKNDALRICLNQIVDDLKELQKNGINIFHDGEQYQFIPTLLSICGDNRAKPEIIGYNYVSTEMF